MSGRLVVYTVLIGDKEPLGNPLAALERSDTDLDIDFVCFTDNRALRSDVWRFHYIDSGHLPAEKLSRRPKALPHEYLRDHDRANTVIMVQVENETGSYDLARDHAAAGGGRRHALQAPEARPHEQAAP